MKRGPMALPAKGVMHDPAMSRVIDAQARMKEMQRELAALRADRDQLLSEYTDALKARTLAPVQVPRRRGGKDDLVRVSAGDLHGMRQDRKAVAAFLADVRRLDPDEIVLGGDMLEVGGWLSKTGTLGYVAESDYSYQEDCQAAGKFLDALQAAAPRAEIIMLEGNHEDRVERWCMEVTRAHGRDAEFLRAAFGPQIMLRIEERKIVYFRRSGNYLPGLPPGWIKRGKMFFTHELGSGKNAARDAALQTAGNVTYFHTHREDSATVVFPGVGIVKAFCPGCLCVRQPMWQHSKPTGWSHGYAVDIVASSGNFQRIHVPIWDGMSLAGPMVERFKS